jgi:hypothetical protein
LLAFNTTPFELFAKELPEGPEGKHWLAPSEKIGYLGLIRLTP